MPPKLARVSITACISGAMVGAHAGLGPVGFICRGPAAAGSAVAEAVLIESVAVADALVASVV
ncbi:hypothetical protein GCM10011378_13750 [Hymenobacter glacieicola]|uniref:Uncharacterized protein n=1 Tax=Hymenobacter glacieicola TaxID=1562124 RepID=A0ABQ1WRX4_9BACT|nr:hypothetical protein GCM10011378_13750 [Hymenobacter glacieicola]